MTITGAHVLLYSPEADALRAMLGDTFGWKGVDAGGGWLIFALAPAEVAVHSADTLPSPGLGRGNDEVCLWRSRTKSSGDLPAAAPTVAS